MRNQTKTDKVREFSEATGGSPPFKLWSDYDDMKIGLIQEEYDEFFKALQDELMADKLGDVVTPEQIKENILKEMVDIVYVIIGYALYRGWDFDTAFNRVAASNMSKLGDDGKPVYREDGKVMKGPNYKPAYLGDLV